MADNVLTQLSQMRATPRNKLMGLVADSLGWARDYANRPNPAMPGGLANPPLSMLSNLLAVPSLATTADRASYGAPLTNAGQANTPFLKPETADAMMMAPLSPRTALGAVGLAAGVGDAGALRAATVWHGSPHKFDKFDASKIGTGEGAQAYGHGLYLAESSDVAKSYQQTLGKTVIEGVNVPDQPIYKAAAYAYEVGGGTLDGALKYAKSQYWTQDGVDAIKALNGASFHHGALYKVDLPDEHIAKMLDWDKPLSQQHPEVQKALSAAAQNLPPGLKDQTLRSISGQLSDYERDWAPTTGAALYRQIGQSKGAGQKVAAQGIQDGSPAVSDFLRQQGIPGIRYLDGGSRTAGQGSSNYVVFPGNENILQILARNGQDVGR